MSFVKQFVPNETEHKSGSLLVGWAGDFGTVCVYIFGTRVKTSREALLATAVLCLDRSAKNVEVIAAVADCDACDGRVVVGKIKVDGYTPSNGIRTVSRRSACPVVDTWIRKHQIPAEFHGLLRTRVCDPCSGVVSVMDYMSGCASTSNASVHPSVVTILGRLALADRGVDEASFLKAPTKYPHVLGHALCVFPWICGYQADTIAGQSADVWMPLQCMPLKGPAAGDCEDSAMQVVLMFNSISRTPPEAGRWPLAFALHTLARQYTPFIVDGAMKSLVKTGFSNFIHMFVRLEAVNGSALPTLVLDATVGLDCASVAGEHPRATDVSIARSDHINRARAIIGPTHPTVFPFFNGTNPSHVYATDIIRYSVPCDQPPTAWLALSDTLAGGRTIGNATKLDGFGAPQPPPLFKLAHCLEKPVVPWSTAPVPRRSGQSVLYAAVPADEAGRGAVIREILKGLTDGGISCVSSAPLVANLTGCIWFVRLLLD